MMKLPETPQPPEGWHATNRLRFAAKKEAGSVMLQQLFSGIRDGGLTKEWFFVPWVESE